MLLHLRRHRTAYPLITLEEGLSRAEAQEHVKTHGNVVVVVCDIEANQFMALTVLIFPEREDQTTELRVAVLHLYIGDTIVLQPRIGNF